MKLRIPEQLDSTNSTIPTHPRKIKKWLADLPQANMGEMTKQIFSAIREINRTKVPAKHRLEMMEMLREPSRSIFNNLKKYFINRSFPLPEKSKKIVHLNQALLQEIALGYKIVLQQAAEKSEKLNEKSQALAIARAIKYQSELFLRASEIYAPVPANLWLETHQIFVYAMQNEFHQIILKDIENPNEKTSVENIYKQMLLLSLARPTAMRQSDNERVYKKLYDWSGQVSLGTEIEESHIDRYFCIRTEEDKPPSYLNQHDLDSSSHLFTLNTTELVDSIREEISQSADEKESMTVGDEISPQTLKSLTLSWGEMPKRRFSRAFKQGHIVAAIGLANATKMIQGSNLPEELVSMQDSFEAGDTFSLENIPDDMKAMNEEASSTVIHTETNSTPNNAWDMVARGTAMTNAFDQQRKSKEAEALKLNKEDDDLHWEVVNVSAGGYCLRWNSDNTSKAQIGELIALHEREGQDNYEWRIGVIRWMQFTSKNGLEIGVQVLSPKVIASQAQRLNRLNETPFEALMIPGIRPLNQAATIILPAHAFNTGDKLKVEVFEQSIKVKLSDKKEHTGSFTQFQFIHLEHEIKTKKIEKKEKAIKKKDDFDEIWSSL